MIDAFADSQAIVTTAKEAESIGRLVTKALHMLADIEAQEKALAARKAEYKGLIEHDLPQAMLAANCSEFKAADGRQVTLKNEVWASIPKGREAEAFAWLRANGHESLIKHEIKVSLDRGKDNVAGEIVHRLHDEYGVDPTDKLTVHAQTLSAFCREQLAQGVDLPAETLGLYAATVARIR